MKKLKEFVEDLKIAINELLFDFLGLQWHAIPFLFLDILIFIIFHDIMKIESTPYG